MKRKLFLAITLVMLMLCLFALSVSAKEYSPTSSAELISAIGEINASAEANIVNLGGSYLDTYVDDGYVFTTSQNITFNLISDVQLGCRFKFTGGSTVVFNLNGYSMKNTVARGGDVGTQFYFDNADLTTKIYNGTIEINDVCFWFINGNLECDKVTIKANEEAIWSGGYGTRGYITFTNCNIDAGGEALFKFKNGSCGGTKTRTFTITGCTLSCPNEVLIQCPASDSVIKDNTITKGNLTLDSWCTHGSTKQHPMVIDNITIADKYGVKALASSDYFTVTNSKVNTVYVNGDNGGGCTMTVVDCKHSSVSFGATKTNLSNIYTITSPDCENAGVKLAYEAGSTTAVADEQYPVDNPALGHGFDANNITDIAYGNGYMEKGLCTSDCIRCDAQGIVESTASASPLFVCNGYSKPEDGTIAVAVSFNINKNAISTYESVTGKSVEYGAAAASYDNLGKNTILDEKGNVTELEKGGVVKAPITKENVKSLTLKITGFTKEEHKDVKLVLGAYVITTKDDVTTVSYLQAVQPEEGYSYITYNTIPA